MGAELVEFSCRIYSQSYRLYGQVYTWFPRAFLQPSAARVLGTMRVSLRSQTWFETVLGEGRFGLFSPNYNTKKQQPRRTFLLFTSNSEENIKKHNFRITFGHVSPRTLCAQVAIERRSLRKRAAAGTINPTSSILSVTKFARMVRYGVLSAFWYFCHVFLSFLQHPSSLTPPLCPPPLLLRSHSLSSWLCPFS